MTNRLIIALVSVAALLESRGSATTEVASSSSSGKGFTARWFAPKTVTLPVGTVITIRTEAALSTESNRSGERFRASLSAPLVHEEKVILPAGTSPEGLVTSSDKGGRVNGVAFTLRQSVTIPVS